VIVNHALHPRSALVVGEEHRDRHTGLHQEHSGVEQVRHERRFPHRSELTHKIVLAALQRDFLGLGFAKELGEIIGFVKDL
jgi:hypothetical protein